MERWKINLYTIWCSQVISIMSFSFGMPFLPFYIQELGITSPENIKYWSSLLNAAPAITMAVMAPIWGIISDKYGRKLMLIRAMFFAAFIIGGMGIVANVNQLLILRICQGIFTGTVTAATILIASNTPKKRLSYALGVLSSSTFIGQSLGPVIGGFLAEFVGFRVSFVVGGILMFLDFLLVLLVVKEEKMVKDKKIGEEKPSSRLSIFTAITISMLMVLFFLRIGRTSFYPYLPIYVQEIMGTAKGVSGTTGAINGFLSFATALSGLTLSRLGDKYDKRKLLLIYLISGTILSLPLMYINSLWIFSLVLGLVFFITGGVEPVIMSMTTENTPVNKRGFLFGIQGTVGNIGFAIAPLLGGIISIKYSTAAVLICIPIFLLISGLTVWVTRIKKPA